MALRDTINQIIVENGNRLRANALQVSFDVGRALRGTITGPQGIATAIVESLVTNVATRITGTPTQWAIGLGVRFRQWTEEATRRNVERQSVPAETRAAEQQAQTLFGSSGGPLGVALLNITSTIVGLFSILSRYAEARGSALFQDWNRAFRPTLVNEAPLMEVWRRRLTSDAAVTDILSRYGLNGEGIQMMLQAARPILPLDAIRELYLRGWLTEQERNSLITNHGYSATDVTRITALYPAMPSPSDLVTFSHREAFEPDQVAELQLDTGFDPMYASSRAWWDAAGVTEPLARLYWRVGWQIPSPTMLFEMFHRKLISRELLNSGLKAHDYQPMWNEPLIGLSYTRPTLVDIRRMHALGTITETQMVDQLERRGLSPDDARKVADFYVAYNRDVSTIGKVKPKQLTADAITSAVDDGLIAREDAENRLVLLGYRPDDANILVGKVLYDRQRRLLKDRQAAVIARLKANRLSEDAARSELAENQMPEDEIDAVVDRAMAEALVKGDPITEAQAKTAYEKGLMPVEDIQQELLFRGYTPRRVGLLFRLWGEYGAKAEDTDNGNTTAA